jgi:hypothetical protein
VHLIVITVLPKKRQTLILRSTTFVLIPIATQVATMITKWILPLKLIIPILKWGRSAIIMTHIMWNK